MNTLFVALCPKCKGDRITFRTSNGDYFCQDCYWKGDRTELELIPMERKYGNTNKSINEPIQRNS